MEDVNVYETDLVYDDVIGYLNSIDIIPSKVFSKIFFYFLRQEKLSNLTEDQKCLLVASLMQLDVDMPVGKVHSCLGKKSSLKSYYDEHIGNCTIEMQEEIADLMEEKMMRILDARKKREELEIQKKYPEIYDELIGYRIEKNKAKIFERRKA